MPTSIQISALTDYANLMEEAKLRLACIDAATSGTTRLPSPIAREFCFLQLRMLCELIALACLTVHGDIKGTSYLREKWSAGTIMNKLEELHPSFYPRPVRQTTTGNQHKLVGVKSGFLTKKELVTLNGKCGVELHRGELRNLSPRGKLKETSLADIVSWRNKLSTLLDQHLISLADAKSLVICFLQNADDTNNVQVVFAEGGPSPPSI